MWQFKSWHGMIYQTNDAVVIVGRMSCTIVKSWQTKYGVNNVKLKGPNVIKKTLLYAPLMFNSIRQGFLALIEWKCLNLMCGFTVVVKWCIKLKFNRLRKIGMKLRVVSSKRL